jgi:glycosyltransferase involved in cell wall biosynthesis
MIYNGVERNREPLSENEVSKLRASHFKVDKKTTLIGLIGRFNRLKGHKLLIEAFETIQLDCPNSKLCFIGSPPEGQEYFLDDIIEHIKKKNLSSKIDILPFQEDIFSIIDALDIIVVPSTEPESFGIIAVESMLSKTVVVASKLGGLEDVLDHNETGILFEPNNKTALAQGILRVMKDEKFKEQLEKKAYRKAKSTFSSESMTNKFISVYNTITQ